MLRSVGIEVGNLYAGFVALIVKLLTNGSELVAITPRSFCNGPYFKPFRTEFLGAMSLRRLHVFESRTEAFRNDDVLQETVIVHAVKESAKPKRVLISSSSGKAGDPVSGQTLNYEGVVQPDDPEQFIHLRVCEDRSNAHSVVGGLPATLTDLGANGLYGARRGFSRGNGVTNGAGRRNSAIDLSLSLCLGRRFVAETRFA